MDHFFKHFVQKCATIAVQGADPGTTGDVGAVREYSTLSLRLGKLVTKNILPVGVNVSLCIAERQSPVGMGTTTEIPLTYAVVGWQQNSQRHISTKQNPRISRYDWIP